MAALPQPRVILFNTRNPNFIREYNQKLQEFKDNGNIDINSIEFRDINGSTVRRDIQPLPEPTFKCTGIAGFGIGRDGSIINFTEEYMKKKSIKDELVSQIYNVMDKKQNQALLDILFRAKESINTRYTNGPNVINKTNPFDLIIKGGGACKIYYDRLMILWKSRIPKHLHANIQVQADAKFKESISDIDVDFYGDYDASTTYFYMVTLLRHIRVRNEATIITIIDNLLANVNANILGYINNPNNTIKKKINESFNLRIPNIDTHQFVTAVITRSSDNFKDSIIQKYKKFLYSADVDDIITNDEINYRNRSHEKLRDEKKLGSSVNITFANEYELCNPVTNKFSLARLNIHLNLKLDNHADIPFKISLYDIGYGVDCNEGYLHNKYHTGIKFIKAENRLPVYGLSYVVNDLFNMLYINNIKTWSLPKYAKRIKRLINYAIFLELDYHSKAYVIQTIGNLRNAFQNTVADITPDDNAENYYNKISWLMVESQRLKHIGSKLYILTDCMIMFLYKKIQNLRGIDRACKDSIYTFIQDYWSFTACDESNIIPFESKLTREEDASDIGNFNTFKAALITILSDADDFIKIIYP